MTEAVLLFIDKLFSRMHINNHITEVLSSPPVLQFKVICDRFEHS